METEIKMVSSASRVLSYYKENPDSIDEDIFQDLADYISSQGINDEKVIRAMIASATRAIQLKRKNLNSFDKQSEKQILKQVIDEIPSLAEEISGY